MAPLPIFKIALWLPVVLCCTYFCFLSILINGWAQRQAIYAHKLNTAWLYDPNEPEQFGFSRNQVRPFFIRSPDGERLYGWHILPLATYIQHEDALLQQSAEPVEYFDRESAEESYSLKLLTEDPESSVIINFHGNAGTVSQGWRTDTYRSLTSLPGKHKVHVLTIDYRGYGYSSGDPTEEGIITDGLTLVQWVVKDLGVPPEKIIILAQSLGTAVATAVAERLAVDDGIWIKKMVLVAGFSDIPTLMRSYRIAGIIPTLSPLNAYPKLQDWFLGRIQETWYTTRRLADLIHRSGEFELFLIHAKDDREIPWQHSNALFHAAANATSERGMTIEQIDGVKQHKGVAGGGFVNQWVTRSERGGRIFIRQEVVPHGGHNRVTTYPVVARNALKMLTS